MVKYYICFILLIHTLCTMPLVGQVPTHAKDSALISKFLLTATEKTFTNFGEATQCGEQAIQLAQKASNPLVLLKSYRTLGLVFEQNGRLEQAKNYYYQALTLEEFAPNALKLDVYLDFAIVNKKIGNYKISQDYYNKALDLATKIKDGEMIEFAYTGLATLHGALTNFEKAIEYNFLAIEAAEKINDQKGVCVGLRNLSLVYLKSQNNELAINNCLKAQKLAEQLKDTTELTGALWTYGKIQYAQNNFIGALECHLKAVSLAEKIGDKRILTDCLIVVADDYMRLGDLNKSAEYYQKCLNYKDYLSYYERPTLALKRGTLFEKRGQYTEAISALQESVKLATKGQFKDILQQSNKTLAQIYNKTGDKAKAYNCLQTAYAYADTLFNEDKAKHVTEAQFKYDVEQSEIKIHGLQLRQSKLMLGTAIAFFSLVVFSLAWFLRQRVKNNSALKLKNTEIQLQNRRLKESNEILHQFAFASAHDLKEPLRNISSFTSIIQRRYLHLLPPEASEFMGFVIGGVKRMESLISALLEYSTVAAEKEGVVEETALKSVLDEVFKNLFRALHEKEGSIFYPDNLPILKISRLHLIQLFQNLISNALKFSVRPPVVAIHFKLSKTELLITIQDNGIGMKQEYSEKVFHIFQRLSRSDQYEGAGVGLTICKNIVEKYDGKIWLESAEGEGTTFFISFPATIVKAGQIFAPTSITESYTATSPKVA